VPPSWKSPHYHYDGVVIDVTSSISSGLPPHRCLTGQFKPLIEAKNRHRILDFGAGALRHTLPLLRSTFQVCAVEFEEAFKRSEAADALVRAERSGNFSKLIWPKAFQKDRRRFDAAILSYVLQVMPEPDERRAVVKHIARKLEEGGYLLYMSRIGQVTPDMKTRKLNDGFWMWPNREYHSFYREFSSEETHELMEKHGLVRERSWSEGGKEQVFLYRKPAGEWV
jgi:hypothetical protein